MSLQHKTDAELIETATKLAGYSEAGPVLKELLSRWQVQRQLADVQHQQMINLAAESELLHQHAVKQSDAVSEIITILASVAPKLTPDQQLELSAGTEKLVPSLTLSNTVSQIRAVEVVDLQGALATQFSASTLLYPAAWQNYFTCPLGPFPLNATKLAAGHIRHQLYNLTGMKAPHQPR